MSNNIDFKIGADLKQFRTAMGNIDQNLRSLSGGFSALGGVIGASFAVDAIGQFIGESVQLAAKMEGVQAAFERLNDPNLLDELRAATKGTVSDFELMKNAVKANNFNIPLKQLGSLLGFAQQRATETGESVDYMVESIVTGIARKSLPILDNLGFSAIEVREEFNKTGDMAAAVANIIDRQMNTAAASTLTLSEQIAQQQATIQNLKTEVGEQLAPVYKSFLDTTTSALRSLNTLLSEQLTGWERLAYAISFTQGAQGEAIRMQIEANKMAREETDKYNKSQENSEEQIGKTTGAMEDFTSATNEASVAIERQEEALTGLVNKFEALDGSAQFSAMVPALEEVGASAFDAFVAFDELATTIGNTLSASFNAALINGENFFKVFVNGLKQMLAQIAATIAAALVLSVILAALPLGLAGLSTQSIGMAFKTFAGPAMGVPSFGINGGLGGAMSGIELFGVLSGSDILLSTERAARNRTRQRGF